MRIDKERAMKSHEFTIVAGGLPIDGDDWHDRFYEAGCDDALLTLQRGVFILHFDREADTLEAAITSACGDVRRAGADIVRVEPDPLVSASDIAERAGITRQAVSLYANGERGDGFPTPVVGISGSRPLWSWSAVAAWLHAAGKLDASEVEVARLLEDLNSRLQPAQEARPASTAVSVQSEFVKIDYYVSRTRRRIDDPKLRCEPSRNAARQRPNFRLRPSQQMMS